MNNFFGYQPFPTGLDDTKCDPDITPSGSLLLCPQIDADTPCEIQDNKFLNCYIVSFSSKLGYGADESSITIELVESHLIDTCINGDCSSDMTDGICVSLSTGEEIQATDAKDCVQQGNTRWICGANNIDDKYNGRLGHVYTFVAGNFAFRGVLSNHKYRESESGYRYTVTLTDSRQVLDSVKVIVGGYYAKVPSELQFNLINALYNTEPSVTDETLTCKGLRCRDFTASGTNHRGMLVRKALEAINNQYIQIPISKACLSIDVTEIIDQCNQYIRVTSNEMSVLELISLACSESGWDFYTKIEGNTIKVYKVLKNQAFNDDILFNFIESIDKNTLIERDYGQELTFEKSKKFIIGDNYRYLLMLDEDSNCAETEPVVSGAPACSVGFVPPALHEYKSANMDFVEKITDIKQDAAILAPSGLDTCNPTSGVL